MNSWKFAANNKCNGTNASASLFLFLIYFKFNRKYSQLLEVIRHLFFLIFYCFLTLHIQTFDWFDRYSFQIVYYYPVSLNFFKFEWQLKWIPIMINESKKFLTVDNQRINSSHDISYRGRIHQNNTNFNFLSSQSGFKWGFTPKISYVQFSSCLNYLPNSKYAYQTVFEIDHHKKLFSDDRIGLLIATTLSVWSF